MSEQTLSIQGLAQVGTLKELSQLLLDPEFGETAAQKFLEEHPNVLAPLELMEILRHLRFTKRNLVNPSIGTHSSEVRIPDFAGVKFFPETVPVIIELKSPQASILGHSSLDLTDEATICAKQLREAVVHLLRPEGLQSLHDQYGWNVREAVGHDIIKSAEGLDHAAGPSSRDWIDLMHKLMEEGVSLIALIGQSSEFNGRCEVLERARLEFDIRGCILLTYDELLLMNETLVDYAQRNTDLYSYFAVDRTVHRAGGSICKFGSTSLLSEKELRKVQQLIHRTSNDMVCLYGLGPPPPPTQVDDRALMWRATAYFDVGMLWSTPTHLKGEERLLWAGRLENRWFVIKERLSEPFTDAVVWYEFGPPITVEPIFGTMGTSA